ncbi:hypothetical protein V0242_18685 [Aeromonas hydrophila]|uniref:hypothetical protein n=1 Tax=Aeromonas hydrophila TaxID=644 RepID=UPI002ED246C1|nr:hypothetical protein V0242_18685 [Aeromonas hydrophila]
MIESKYTPLELESITPSELAHAYLATVDIMPCIQCVEGDALLLNVTLGTHTLLKLRAIQFSTDTETEATDLIEMTMANEKKRILDYIQSQDECFQFEYLMQGGILQ